MLNAQGVEAGQRPFLEMWQQGFDGRSPCQVAGARLLQIRRALLGAAPGVTVEDDPRGQVYPTPAEVAGKDDVYVGRIRRDPSTRNGIALWIVSDNLRKGAALNAVQVAERAIEMGVI